MKKNPNILWFSVFLLGWLFDLLFWGQSIGINLAIYATLCVAGGLLILRSAGQRPAGATLWLLVPLAFFVAVPALRAEPMTAFLGLVFTAFLLAIFTISFLGGRWLHYSLADYFAGFLGLLGSVIGRPIAFNLESRREQDAEERRADALRFWPIVRGIVIAVPIVAIFAALLSSADSVFSKGLDDFLRLFFDASRIPEYIFRFVYILFIAYALAGIFLHAGSQSKDEKLRGQDRPLVARFLGFTETSIILGSVIVLFTAFVIVQFRYFFGGAANLAASGITDSEYARRGFGELAAVAFLSLLLILGLTTITQRTTTLQSRIYSGFCAGLVALVLVILVSAYQRLLLNEQAHGFFRLRTYSHVFYIWLAALLVAVVILEMLHRERLFALAAIMASLGFAASLTALNVDAFTAQQSIQRAEQGYYLNIPDVASLSSDSVPVLVDAFLSPSVSETTRQRIGAILVCRQAVAIQSADFHPDWRSFSFSSWAADQAIAKAKPYLKGYNLNKQTYPTRVRPPGSPNYYECQNYYPD